MTDIEAKEEVQEVAAKGSDAKGGGVQVAGIQISQLRMPLVGMFLSACVLLIAVMSWNQNKANPIRWREYAISVPAVCMSLSFLFILMTFKESFYKSNGKYANIVLFIWNFIGACLLTFIDPFTATGNGYFASWVMVACSAAALGLSANTFKSSVQGVGALVGLLAASIVVIIAISPHVGKNSLYRNHSIYTISVASVTLAVILVHMYKEHKLGHEKSGGIVALITLVFFAILWLVVAGLTTFRGPFLTTGNGYFAVWFGAAMACSAAMAARKN